MVKKTYIFFILIINIYFDSNICGQGIINNSSNFYLSANSNLILSGNANWIQNGTVTCISNSNVKFTGTNYQYIQGSNSTSFYNVEINNSGGGIVAGRNFSVLGTLTLTQGHFDLKSYTIDLSTSGTISGENENARIRATSGIIGGGTEGGNTGTIRATRDNPSGNVAGLGLNFSPSAALGANTIITRGCNALQGSGTFTGNYSIFRWYVIQPGSGTYTPITVNNFYYWGGTANAELNGHTEANLQMFQWVQYGSGNPTYWEPRTTTPVTGSDYVSSNTSNSISLSYIRVTLGSTDIPLPVELVHFAATCNGNKNILTWQTASEINNDGYEVQKSKDAQEWENIGFVYGQGNSNIVTTYQYEDMNPYYPTTYYRLKQLDFDGKSTFSQIIQSTCNAEEYQEDFQPFFNNGQLALNILGTPNKSYKFILTNNIGQTLYSSNIILSSQNEQIFVNIPLAKGIYYSTLISDKNIISKPFLIK